MRGCATHSNAFQRRHRLKITKPCCRGTTHPHRLAERPTHSEFKGGFMERLRPAQPPGRAQHARNRTLLGMRNPRLDSRMR